MEQKIPLSWPKFFFKISWFVIFAIFFLAFWLCNFREKSEWTHFHLCNLSYLGHQPRFFGGLWVSSHEISHDMRVIKDCNRRRQWTSNRHLSIREIGFRRWLQRECKCNKGSQRFFLCSFSFPRHLPILFSCHLVNKDDSWHVYILGYYHHSHLRIRGSKVYKKYWKYWGH